MARRGLAGGCPSEKSKRTSIELASQKKARPSGAGRPRHSALLCFANDRARNLPNDRRKSRLGNHRRLPGCRRLSNHHHREIRQSFRSYTSVAPERCDTTEPGWMDNCDSLAPSSSDSDDKPARNSRDSLRRSYRHCFDTNARSRWAYSYPVSAGRRWMAKHNRGSAKLRQIHWNRRSAASLPTRTNYHG